MCADKQWGCMAAAWPYSHPTSVESTSGDNETLTGQPRSFRPPQMVLGGAIGDGRVSVELAVTRVTVTHDGNARLVVDAVPRLVRFLSSTDLDSKSRHKKRCIMYGRAAVHIPLDILLRADLCLLTRDSIRSVQTEIGRNWRIKRDGRTKCKRATPDPEGNKACDCSPEPGNKAPLSAQFGVWQFPCTLRGIGSAVKGRIKAPRIYTTIHSSKVWTQQSQEAVEFVEFEEFEFTHRPDVTAVTAVAAAAPTH
ncbi:hypothetical protein B0T17DRAFT_508305 [Bombardia bombarda]|uniref:Uncharacterized protein n=1 Tax=Bombardia bombarda TaxID=252184 RepID=A0AA39X1X5_9PEZI|nr:hypothetical protein B0T17DRAFT_508305 [Bombardia bombarda]